jgi:uncharacterized membrane protein YoaK (UPF0700 family)
MPMSAPDEGPKPRGGPAAGTGTEAGAGGLPLAPVLLALTVVSGIIDAVGYLALGHVFTANMTGNVAVLGFAAAGALGFSALRTLVSLGAFLVGSAAGGWAGQRFAGRDGRTRRRWVRSILGAEAGLLGLSAALAVVGPGSAATTQYVLIAVTAVAMGLRNATVRRLGVADLTTTVLTMTLTGLAADSPLAGGRSVRTLRRVGSVCALLGGAVLGGWLVLHHGPWLPLLIAAAVSGALALTASARE